jgi:histidinol phosphatase-like PHP family hydrolase
MKADLHVHSSERSACGRDTEVSQIRAAIALGLDAIAFTDHHHLVPAARLEEMNREYAPFKIYRGIEITAQREDWLVFGVNAPELESENWEYAALADFVHQRGGFIALAHPFRYAASVQVDIRKTPPDGIEVQSLNTPKERADEIRKIAKQYGLALLENSDAHVSSNVGKYYNHLPDGIDGDRGLVECLMKMKVK